MLYLYFIDVATYIATPSVGKILSDARTADRDRVQLAGDISTRGRIVRARAGVSVLLQTAAAV
jgi:hypothetical protein